MPHQCTNCGHVFEDGSKEMLSGCPDCGGNKFQYHPGEVPDEQPSTDAEPPEREGGTVSGAVGRAANKVRDAVTSDPAVSSDPETVTESGSTADTESESAADAEPGSVGDESASARDDAPGTPTSSPDSSTASSSPDSSTATDTPDSSSTGEPSKSGDGEAATTETETSPAPEMEGGAVDSGVDANGPDSEDTAQADARSEVVDPNSLPDAPADAPTDGRVVKEPDDPDDRPDLEELRSELNDQFESIRIVAPGQYELNLMELYDRQEYIIALQEDGQYVIEVPDAWETDDE